MNNFNITIGSDPEVFIQNQENEVVSAEGIVPGTKNNPHQITDEGHAIQLDNIAMEYNIPPASTKAEFVHHIHFVKDYLENLANQHGYTLSPLASAEVNPKYLRTKNAKTFGCSPDFNAYLEDVNMPPKAKSKNLRSAGGHIAVGYPDHNFETSLKIVKAFDLFVVIPSMELDKDERRRELYGKAGCFRFTPFGVECRTLSNFWIHSKELTAWVYERTIMAVESVLSGEFDRIVGEYPNIQEIIDSNDKESAKQITIKLNNLVTV